MNDMASFTISMTDSEDGGMKVSIEVKGFLGATIASRDENSTAQNIYFVLAETIKSLGLKIPDPVENN